MHREILADTIRTRDCLFLRKEGQDSGGRLRNDPFEVTHLSRGVPPRVKKNDGVTSRDIKTYQG